MADPHPQAIMLTPPQQAVLDRPTGVSPCGSPPPTADYPPPAPTGRARPPAPPSVLSASTRPARQDRACRRHRPAQRTDRPTAWLLPHDGSLVAHPLGSSA